jgi:putative Mg2+ transporter-C (MgtC) family protein
MSFLTDILTENWRSFFGQPSANILLAVVAVICGSVVGAERQKKEKPAGLRTLTLVSLGSATFTMISIAFSGGEPRYIAAQIVSGIGFLGAGAIMRGSVGVTGMTTAASIWMMAAIGMVVGVGYAIAGLALSGLVLAVLTVIARLELRYLGSCQLYTVQISFDPSGGKAMVKIEDLLDDYHIDHAPLDISTTPEGRKQLSLTYCHAHRHHRELLSHLAAMPEVLEIHRVEVRPGSTPPA